MADRDGLFDLSLGDFLTINQKRDIRWLTYTPAGIVELDVDRVFAGRERVLGGSVRAFQTEIVVMKNQLALQQVQSGAIEAATLGQDRALGGRIGNLYWAVIYHERFLRSGALPSGMRVMPS